MRLNPKLINYIKLFSTGIILLWLFLQSPLNPLYSDYERQDLYFVKIQFVYWVFVSVFLLWLIYFIKKSNYEKYSIFLLISSNFLFLLFFTFYGFDVMDTGFSLSKQWGMFHGLWAENFDAIAGTNFIGGLWLYLYGEPFLLWARLGFVLVQTSIIFVFCKIMMLYFNPKQILIVVLPLSLFFATWNFYQTINYDNLPFLIYAISIYLILKGLKTQTFNKKYFFLSGMFYILAVFSKISYVPAIILPIFLILVDNSLFSKDLLREKILYYSAGVLTGLAFLFIFLFSADGLNAYIYYFDEIITELSSVKAPTKIHTHNHSFVRLYDFYKDSILFMLNDVTKFVFFIIVIEYIRTKVDRVKLLKYFTVILGVFIMYYSLFEKNSQNQYTEGGIRYYICFFLSIYIIWAFFTTNEIIKKYAVLILASGGMFLFSFVGSDLVFRAAFHIGSGILLFSISVILIRECDFRIRGQRFKFTFLFYFILIFFSINIIYKKDNFYREPGFKFLSEPFKTHSISGIKSTPQRVDVVDSLLTYLKNIPEIESKKIIFTHSNPLMYYLSGTNYPLSSPWDIINDFYKLEQDLRSVKPEFFVIPKLSHRLRTWPLNSESDDAESRAKNHYETYERFIKENEYSVAYKNSFYTVYSREK